MTNSNIIMNKLIVSPVDDKLWELQEDFTYNWSVDGKDYSIVIYKGFITDFASIPSIFWTLTNTLPSGKHSPAALIHDALYMGNGNIVDGFGLFIINGKLFKGKFTRDECDRLFLRVCRENGVEPWKRKTMYYFLTVFGWIGWKHLFGFRTNNKKTI